MGSSGLYLVICPAGIMSHVVGLLAILSTCPAAVGFGLLATHSKLCLLSST